MTAMVTEKHFDDADTLVEALAGEIASQLRAAVAARGQAIIAVSGGSSPKRLFARLSQIDLPWSQVIVTQVDERWVPLDHEDSNARLVREHLLRDAARAARFVPLKNAAASPEEGSAEAEMVLRKLGLPFDLVLLGMGEDGHTASLFPDAAELTRALDPDGSLSTPVRPPVAPHPRISLTLAGLLASRRLVLPLWGAAKLKVLDDARGAGAVEDMPIRAVLRQNRVPLDLWLAP